MLIEFSVANFKSIRERQTLSMVASKYYKELVDDNTFEVTSEEEFPRLLKSAVVYGPNASGKSTLVEAMQFVDEFVRTSANESQSGDNIGVVPFKLAADSRQSDTSFEVAFFEGGTRYEFGFCANAARVTQEWLYAYPRGNAQRMYVRHYDDEAQSYHYVWGKNFQGGRRKIDWKNNTRPNALFLSAAIQLNCEQLQPVFNWFKSRVATLDPTYLTASYTLQHFEERKSEVMDFLSAADLFISDIKINRTKFDPSVVPPDMPAAIREEVIKRMAGSEISEPKFYLDSVDGGGLIEFTEDELSAGTKALFNFSGPWIDVVSNSRVLFVDELDSSLHPLVVHQLIRILHNSAKPVQMVFTTHDTSILGHKGILRRDQVWMIEKNSQQESFLTPLSDYSVREGEALEKGYLGGRYGGIPFVKDLTIGQ